MRYRPIIALGQGGMADVLLSVGRGPSGFNKLVVLKTLRKELIADDEMRQMFLAEARLSARLNNANVVHVYEVLDTTLPCIVMEYLEGQPLSMVYREAGDAFTLPLQIKVLSEALAGLHYSHELKDYDGTPLHLVHRDVSPQNIFVTYDGVVKVLDFGIAKASNVTNNTRTGIVKGKIAYMPREQLLGEDVDRRTDIYSIGCILWQVAAGAKLWSGMHEGEIMRALIDGRIPRPSEKRPVDPILEEIIMKALAPDADNRYPTALAMRHALDQYLVQTCPNTSMREVGELVSNVFAEQQDARAKQIQILLGAPVSEAPPPIPEGLESVVQSSTGNTSKTQESPRQGKTTLVVAAAAVAALIATIGTVVFLNWRAAKPPLQRAGVVASPTQIQVRITASPAAATLSVDGNPVSGNPALLTVPIDTRDHEIRATLAGYETYREVVHFERDMALEIMLPAVLQPTPSAAVAASDSPKADSKSPVRTAIGRKVRTAGPATTGAKPKDNCDPPYTFENGIKAYKPGCL